MSRRRLVLSVVAFAAALPFTAPAAAVDGVLEIHAGCIAAGCFPGDGPGFPVEITQPGSYRLTAGLQVPDENTTAIRVLALDVLIDLGGFTIRGVTDCSLSGGTVTCSPLGSGIGIEGGAGSSGMRVRDGVVRGMGSDGLRLGANAHVEGMTASECGAHGFAVPSGGSSAGWPHTSTSSTASPRSRPTWNRASPTSTARTASA